MGATDRALDNSNTHNKITYNKTFWKNIQPLFSEKIKLANKITLEDSEKKHT